MKRKFISAEQSFAQWKTDALFVEAYNSREEEFALARQRIAVNEGQRPSEVTAPAKA